ncbi:MAG: Uma2 family endonuclease [Cyanobacterium sp.]
MVVALEKKISLAEFLNLPETKPAQEYIDGNIYPKIMPQGKHSRLQTRLSTAINQAGESDNLVLALTELRCTFANRSIVPDISVFLWENIPLDEQGEIIDRFQIPPDWIIEILSPEQSPNSVINKIIFCLNHGTKLGWFIDTKDKSVMIFQANKLPEIKYHDDQLSTLDILQNWQISVDELFNWLKLGN